MINRLFVVIDSIINNILFSKLFFAENHKSNQRLKAQTTIKTSNIRANPAISSQDFLTFLFGGQAVSTPAPSHGRQQRRFTSTPKPTMCDNSPWLCIQGQPIFQNSK